MKTEGRNAVIELLKTDKNIDKIKSRFVRSSLTSYFLDVNALGFIKGIYYFIREVMK